MDMEAERGHQQVGAASLTPCGRFLLVLVTVLATVATILGIVAAVESRKITISKVKLKEDGECDYPKSLAFELGLASATMLTVVQVILHSWVAALLPKPWPRPHWTVVVNLLFGWVMFLWALYYLGGPEVGLSRRKYVSNYDSRNQRLIFANCISVTPFGYAIGVVCLVVSITNWVWITSRWRQDGRNWVRMNPSHT